MSISHPSEKLHKIYVSYHHTTDNAYYKDLLIQNTLLVEKAIVTRDDDFAHISPDLNILRIKQLIRERMLRDTTVTVVLVGRESWKRKHTDWEISASLTDTDFASRSGLVGILLPTHPEFDKEKISPFTIPPRLYDNVEYGYAKLHKWTDDPVALQTWIHDAFIHRQELPPHNSRPAYTKNLIGGDSWKQWL